MLDPLLIAVISVFLQIFAIMDPVGIVPIYLSFMSGLDQDRHRRIVTQTILVCLGLVTLFTVAGSYILSFFNVSIAATRIGGGILLVAIAIDMLGGLPRTKHIPPEEMAVVPIATPLLVGPGTITTLILLSTVYPLYVVLIGSYLVVAITYLMLRYVDTLYRVLGPGIIKTLARLMAIIVAAIAIEMILTGVEDYIEKLSSKVSRHV